MKKKWLNPDYHEPEETPECGPIKRWKFPRLLVYWLALIALSAIVGEIARLV